jgi:hypothetical protein
MKRFLLVLFLASFVMPQTMAQDDPIPPKRSRMSKMGLFGGFTPGYLFMDVKPINSFLTGGKFAAVSEGGVFMTGGAGAAYIMVLPNVRVGGMGLSGGLKSSSVEGTLRRDAQLSVGMGALTVEYVVPVVPRLDAAFGATVGWGFIDLTLRQNYGGANTWTGEQQILAGPSGIAVPPNATRILNGSFLLLSPTVNVEYAVLPWLALRVGASYSLMMLPSWRVDGEYELLGVPSDVKGQGLMLQGGILVGTF